MFLVWPTKFEKYFEFYAQPICCLKNKGGECWNLNFWENWVLNLEFVKIISSHTHAFFFFLILQCFEERLLKILLIFKNSFFLQFWSIEFVFRAIEIAIKNFSESLSISIDRKSNWINRKSEKKKNIFLEKVTWIFENIPQSIEYNK